MDADQLKAVLKSVEKTHADTLKKVMEQFKTEQESDRQRRYQEQENRKKWEESSEKKLKESEEKVKALEARLSQAGENLVVAPSNGTATQQALPHLAHVKPPSALRGDATLLDFNCWYQSWTDFSTLIGMSKFSQKEQLGMFRSALSNDVKKTIQFTLGIKNDTDKPVEDIISLLKDHIKKDRNIYLHRYTLMQRKQQDGEKFDHYLAELKTLAENTDPCEHCKDQHLTTLVICGLRDSSVRQKLLGTSEELTLDKVAQACRSSETAKAAERDFNKMSSKAVNKTSHMKGPGSQAKSQGQQKNGKPKCKKCNKNHDGSAKCPAANFNCNFCKEKGHYGVCCPKKGQQAKGGDKKLAQIKIRHVQFGHEAPQTEVQFKRPAQKEYKATMVTPDSAAEGTVAGPGFLKQLGIKKSQLKQPEGRLVGVTGNPLECIGMYKVKFKLNEMETEDIVYICPHEKGVLLSWYACQNLGILHKDYPGQLVVQKVSVPDRVSLLGGVPESPTAPEIQDIEAKLKDMYKDVFDQNTFLPIMDGEPMKIHLKDNAKPYNQISARAVPYAQREAVKKELDKMVELGVAEPMGDEPSTWCHPLVVVSKKEKGALRVTVDLTKLNDQVQRVVYPTLTPKDAVTAIPPGMKYFTTLDATKGYWQVALEKESQDLTTFITPWGRYRHLRAPMGFISTGDEYCRRGDLALQGIQNVKKVVDDILTYSPDFRSHVASTIQLLDKCREHKITLNPKKFVFAKPEVEYVGYRLGSVGIKADPSKLKAIAEFPAPTCRKDLNTFMGMVKYLGNFSNEIAAAAGPLRPLLSMKNEFLWLPEHLRAFGEVKKTMTSPPILAHFDVARKTVLQTDASRLNGLGYVLLQLHDDGYKLVECGSRFISETESRYSMVELELLAIVWAVTKKLRVYLAGLPEFKVITDHRPLLSILNEQTLDVVESPRIQRLKEKLSMYNFKVEWQKGSEHCMPDALSRFPVNNPQPDDLIDEEELQLEVKALKIRSASLVGDDDVIPESHLVDQNLERVKEAAASDNEYRLLKKTVEDGFPESRQKLVPEVAPFWNIKDELCVVDTLVMYGRRIVMPRSLRLDTLKRLHASHQGIEKTRRRAQQTVYWPGISADIKNTVGNCTACQERLPSLQQETYLCDPMPLVPFAEVAADLFTHAGKQYLAAVDRLSGWPCVWPLRLDTSTTKVKKCLREMFVTYGVPSRLRSDGGPQFTSQEFENFVKIWDVEHQTSSPHYPQSNGLAESGAVKTMKNLVAKCTTNGVLDEDQLCQGLIEFRNTPKSGGKSPAQVVFGRDIKSIVPQMPLKDSWIAVQERRDSGYFDVQEHYNKRAKDLGDLNPGREVFIQNELTKRWDKTGTVIEKLDYRSYLIRLPSGRTWVRNRRFIRPKWIDRNAGKAPTPVETSDNQEQEKQEPRRSTRNRRQPTRLQVNG